MRRLWHLHADRPVRLLTVATVLGLLCSAAAAAEQAAGKIAGSRLAIVRDAQNVTVRQGDQLLLRYRYAGVPKKPYVAELTSPGGVNILLDAPKDHLHHHGLMFAWGVDGVTYWAEAADSGLQVHKAWNDLRVDARRGGGRAVLDEQLSWQTPDGRAVLQENRKLTIRSAGKGRPRVLVWQADFTAVDGATAGLTNATAGLTIAGSKYYGLGMRPIRAMDKGGKHFNAAAGTGVEGTNGRRAAWTAYTAEVAPGKKVTVALFSDPANPRHPCEWFTMGEKDAFAYLSGTLGVGTAPLKLAPGKTLSVRFGVVIFEGAATADDVESEYQRFTKRRPEKS